ncbi:MAG: SDR family oxidoreductase [Myxococcota bacterium]|jgi:thioester reductase-like protein|nr:SDR family oxidoreductase [Myxococcota bacterium]
MTTRTWFITGVTGFVGRELLKRILNRSDDRVIGLVRGRDDEAVEGRRTKVLTDLYGGEVPEGFDARFEAVRGELHAEQLGLDDATWDRVAAAASRIVHSAASVRFDLKLDEARKHNVDGTTRMLDLALRAAELGGLERFAYVGTCYVAGDRTDVVKAEELDVGQGFRNSYEQTKLESEKLVRAHMDRLSIAIFRPSIIVGDSRTGETSSFNVIYWPVRVYARGWWPFFIGNPDAPADVVPINFVCDAMLHILDQDDCAGNCYPLAAGVDGCSTNGEMMKLAAHHFDQPLPEIIRPEEFTDEYRIEMYNRLSASQRAIIGQGIQYLPYMSQNPFFDNTPTLEALAGTDLRPPRVDEYFANLFDFAKRTDWGRRPQGR